MTERADAMLLSREELEVVRACVLICLDRVLMDEDTTKDAIAVLAEIRRFLDEDAQGVADGVGDEIRAEYKAAEGWRGR